MSLSHFFTYFKLLMLCPWPEESVMLPRMFFPSGKKRVMTLVQTYILFALLIHDLTSVGIFCIPSTASGNFTPSQILLLTEPFLAVLLHNKKLNSAWS